MPEVIPNSNYQFRLADSLLGAQLLFVAFGALVLVPLLTGLGFVPAFLAVSFAFIASIMTILVGVNTLVKSNKNLMMPRSFLRHRELGLAGILGLPAKLAAPGEKMIMCKLTVQVPVILHRR